MILRPSHNRRRSRAAWRFVLAAALALFGHAFMVGLVVLSSFFNWPASMRPLAAKNQNRPVSMRTLSESQWNQNRGKPADDSKMAERVTPKTKKPEAKKAEIDPKGQVVDVAPGNNQSDENAKYIAETSNKVKKESRAKEQTAFYRNAMPKRTSTQPVEGTGFDESDRAQLAGNNGRGQDDRPMSAAQTPGQIEIPDATKQQEVALNAPNSEGPGPAVANQSETQEVRGNSTRLNLTPGSGLGHDNASMGHLGQPGAISLLPSAAVVDRITGAAANDHLDNVAEGDGTYLNTREWKYASFFNRVKQSVGQRWNPQTQLQLRDPTGQIYGGKDRHTILTITLDASGSLRDAYVDRSSGLDFLDLEAIKAFERAQPFPNPPAGLLASDQTVRFQFGFFLEMTGRPGLRLFRTTQ